MSNSTLTKEIVRGLVAGLVGTIIMDLVIVGFFAVVGLPLDMIYTFIGDTAKIFFTRLGMEIPGGLPLGAFIHFSLGLVLGGLFGFLVSRIPALRLTSRRKGILLGILYIELASQPILITAPLVQQMTTADIIQWYGLSTVMHMIYGAILGGMLSDERKEPV